MFSERELVDAFTGLVVDGPAVDAGERASRTTCDRCGASLESGDAVTATLASGETQAWKPTGVYCQDHPARSVESAVGTRGADQAVIEATLERTGSLDSTGELHPEALTFGGVVVLDYSPALDGREEPPDRSGECGDGGGEPRDGRGE